MSLFANAPSLRICGMGNIAYVNDDHAPDLTISMIHIDATKIRSGSRHLSLPIPDREGKAASDWAIHAAKTVFEEGRAAKSTDHVLVHCLAGKSRSPAAAIIFLLGWLDARNALTPDTAIDAFRHVIELHNDSLPNGSLLGAADTLLDLDNALMTERTRDTSRHFVANDPWSEDNPWGE